GWGGRCNVATYDGQPIALGATIAGVVLEDENGAEAAPEFPPNPAHRVRGLAFDDGETWVQLGASGGRATVCVVSVPERDRRRRGLRQALRRVRQATQAGEIAEPLDVQRLVLGLVREAFGEED
ncbi:MAG: hypothetical protein ACO4CT_18455, partial [Planctomycetota bacterium]